MAGLARAGLGELAARRGVGPAKAARLAAAIELGRRVAATVARQTDARFPSSSAVDGWARPRLAALESRGALGAHPRRSPGAARSSARRQRRSSRTARRGPRPLRFVLRDGGSAFVLVHNHPSGDPAPSPEDVRFTEEVARAADIVGVPLLDHVIVARGGSPRSSTRGYCNPVTRRSSARSCDRLDARLSRTLWVANPRRSRIESTGTLRSGRAGNVLSNVLRRPLPRATRDARATSRASPPSRHTGSPPSAPRKTIPARIFTARRGSAGGPPSSEESARAARTYASSWRACAATEASRALL